MAQLELAKSLKALVGPDAVIDDPSKYHQSYNKAVMIINPHRPIMTKSAPEVVVRPTEKKQVVETVKFANEHSIPLYVASGGTDTVGGTAAVKGGILLDMKLMNKVLKIDAQERYAVLETGIILSKLEEQLNAKGVTHGHHPNSYNDAAVAGAISHYGIGTESPGFGLLSDNVLGMEVVLPSGELLKIGAKCKTSMGEKNLLWLFLGIAGEHGIITEVTLRVFPLDLPKRRSHAFKYESFEKAAEASLALYTKGIQPSIQYAEAIGELPLLIVAIDSTDPGISDAVEKAVVSVAIEKGGEEVPREITENWLKERHFEDVFAVQRASIHGGVFWPIHSSFLTFQDHIQWYHDTKEICAKYGLEVIQASLYAHPWDLSLLLGYFGQPTDEMREKDSKARYELVQRAVDMGGAADAIHGAGLKSAYFFEQQLGPVGAELLKKIKDVMDPNHILNPGKRWKAVEDQGL